MNANTKISFTVTRDGEVDNELSQVNNKGRIVNRLYGTIQLQTELFIYDLLHGTDYRRIRNRLVRDKRNAEFEARIGLIAVNKKLPREK